MNDIVKSKRIVSIVCYLLYVICFNSSIQGEESGQQKQKICLNMIVKNESKVIKRALASVKPLIDYWVIIDTGSTDQTQEIIKEFMKDIPGELHEQPWKNFEYNRNQAFEIAKNKADYVLLLDADEMLKFEPDINLSNLVLDSYNCIILDAGAQYERTLLVKSELDWKWHGVIHEYIAATQAKTSSKLNNITKISIREGSRSTDPLKYQKDAQLLEDALKEDPNNSRYVFYLAQSYRDAGDHASSLKNYQKRIKMGGWDQEVFYSMLQVARLQEILQYDPVVFITSYFDAYRYRPSRIEPLYYLAKYYRNKNDFNSAYLLTSIGIDIPFPNDILFIDKWIYDYDMKLECSINAYWIGKYDKCLTLSKELLSKSDLPSVVREAVQKNINFAVSKVLEKSNMMKPNRNDVSEGR